MDSPGKKGRTYGDPFNRLAYLHQTKLGALIELKTVENNVSGEAPRQIEKRKKDSARLRWDSKPKRAPNPKDIEFQTAEVVIPNPSVDQSRLSLFLTDLSKATIDRLEMNRLIWGDNLLAMQALLASGYEEKIDLIYIDPPFWTDEDYYLNVAVDGGGVTKSPSVIERLAYKDYWGEELTHILICCTLGCS